MAQGGVDISIQKALCRTVKHAGAGSTPLGSVRVPENKRRNVSVDLQAHSWGRAASGEPERLTGPEPLRVQRKTSLWDWQWSQLPGQEFLLVPTILEME